MMTIPHRSRTRLSEIKRNLCSVMDAQASQWVELFAAIGRAELAMDLGNEKAFAKAMVLVSNIEGQILGRCEISGSLTDESIDEEEQAALEAGSE